MLDRIKKFTDYETVDSNENIKSFLSINQDNNTCLGKEQSLSQNKKWKSFTTYYYSSDPGYRYFASSIYNPGFLHITYEPFDMNNNSLGVNYIDLLVAPSSNGNRHYEKYLKFSDDEIAYAYFGFNDDYISGEVITAAQSDKALLWSEDLSSLTLKETDSGFPIYYRNKYYSEHEKGEEDADYWVDTHLEMYALYDIVVNGEVAVTVMSSQEGYGTAISYSGDKFEVFVGDSTFEVTDEGILNNTYNEFTSCCIAVIVSDSSFVFESVEIRPHGSCPRSSLVNFSDLLPTDTLNGYDSEGNELFYTHYCEGLPVNLQSDVEYNLLIDGNIVATLNPSNSDYVCAIIYEDDNIHIELLDGFYNVEEGIITMSGGINQSLYLISVLSDSFAFNTIEVVPIDVNPRDYFGWFYTPMTIHNVIFESIPLIQNNEGEEEEDPNAPE